MTRVTIDPADYVDTITFGDARSYGSIYGVTGTDAEAIMWEEKVSELVEDYGNLDSLAEFVENPDPDTLDYCLPSIRHTNTAPSGMHLADGHHRFILAYLLGIRMVAVIDCSIAECAGNCLKNLGLDS